MIYKKNIFGMSAALIGLVLIIHANSPLPPRGNEYFLPVFFMGYLLGWIGLFKDGLVGKLLSISVVILGSIFMLALWSLRGMYSNI